MPLIYLHIGLGKTGTTAIQRFMATQRQNLLANSLHYIGAGGGLSGVGHQDFAKSFIRELPFYMVPPHAPEADRKAIADEITQANSDSIVLSSENLVLADIDQVHRYFQELPVSCDVKIIMFVRSQDELAESEYNQLVKMRRETRPIAEYIAHDFLSADFMAIASDWENVFGRENIIARIYDGTRKDAIRQFLSCFPDINATPSSVGTHQNDHSILNVSIGFKALTVARILNSVELENRAGLYAKIFENLSKDDLPALLFDSDQARAFRHQFASSNRAFTERYMGQTREDTGGRRYTDQERDEIRSQIKLLE